MKYAPSPFFVGFCLLITIVCILLDWNFVTGGGYSWLTYGPCIATAVLGAWLLVAAFFGKPNGGSSSGPGASAGGGSSSTPARSSGSLFMLGIPATFLSLAGLPYPRVVEQHVATLALALLAVVVLAVVLALCLGRRPARRLAQPLA